MLIPALILCGCTKQPTDEQHMVSWYMAHKPERLAEEKWCEDDAARQVTANCVNAVEAGQKVLMVPNAKTSADGIQLP
jgi:hypothetical protein